MNEGMRIVGIDLAWGERNPDGVCVLHGDESGAWVLEDWYLSTGSGALRHRAERWRRAGPAWLMVDAPLVCRNRSGRREAEAACQKAFRAREAGPHPVNRSMPGIQRGLKWAAAMERSGWIADWNPSAAHQMIEVFPHPAIVRFFGLEKTIKYKRGRVEERRTAFRSLQRGLKAFLRENLPDVEDQARPYGLLDLPWQKPVEDQVDALVCALVGWNHYVSAGRESEVFGTVRDGFILVPGGRKWI